MKKMHLLLLSALCCLLVGCTTPPAESATPTLAPSPDLVESQTGYRFIFVCPVVGTDYWDRCAEGIAKADSELGTATEVVGPDSIENFVTEIVPHMEWAISEKPDCIITYAGVETLHPLIDQAVDSGIPVLTIDADAPNTKRTAYVGTDLYALGYQAGELVVEATGGGGKVAYLCSSFSAQGEATVFGAFEDAIHDYHLHVGVTAEGGTTVDSSVEATKALLAEHSEINAIFSTASNNATGTGRAAQELGRTDLVIVGLDDDPASLELVRQGAIDALLVQDPFQMGYQGVYLMKELVDKGGLSRESYGTGTILVTAENVDSYK